MLSNNRLPFDRHDHRGKPREKLGFNAAETSSADYFLRDADSASCGRVCSVIDTSKELLRMK